MSRQSQWTWQTKSGQTHIVRPKTTAAAAARTKARTACRAYRLDNDHVYVVHDMPSMGECLDLLVGDLAQATSPAPGRSLPALARRALAGLAAIGVVLLPLGVVELVATAYVAWVASRAEVPVVDVRAEAGLPDDAQYPGWWR